MNNQTYEAAVQSLRARLTPDILGRIGAVYAFHFLDDGTSATLDGSSADGLGFLDEGPADRDLDPDFEITLTHDDFAQLITGRLHPMAGMATGRLRMRGSMKEAIKLDRLLRA